MAGNNSLNDRLSIAYLCIRYNNSNAIGDTNIPAAAAAAKKGLLSFKLQWACNNSIQTLKLYTKSVTLY